MSGLYVRILFSSACEFFTSNILSITAGGWQIETFVWSIYGNRDFLPIKFPREKWIFFLVWPRGETILCKVYGGNPYIFCWGLNFHSTINETINQYWKASLKMKVNSQKPTIFWKNLKPCRHSLELKPEVFFFDLYVAFCLFFFIHNFL